MVTHAVPVLQKSVLQAHGQSGTAKPPAVVNVLVTTGVLVVVALAGGMFLHGSMRMLM